MAGEPCLSPGCEAIGVFPGTRGEGVEAVRGAWCFDHDPGPVVLPDGEVAPVVEQDDGPTFHTDVTSGLAAMILEHTAMTTLDGDDPAGDAMRSLASATAMTTDVAAGILLATTAMMALGGILPEQLTGLAEVWEAMAEDDGDQDDADNPIPEGLEADPLDDDLDRRIVEAEQHHVDKQAALNSLHPDEDDVIDAMLVAAGATPVTTDGDDPEGSDATVAPVAEQETT